jgi:Tfp pilus assembly protein PilO
MSWNKNSYQQKIIINIFFTATILSVLAGFVILPSAEAISQIKENISSQKINLENNYLRGKNLRKLAENLKLVEPRLDSLKKIFISRSEALTFVTSLEKIAEENGINQKIGLTSPSENGATNKKNDKIPLQLISSGTFLAQMKYLAALESANYYINVKALELSGSAETSPMIEGENKKEGEKSRTDMQIIADTYWQD